MAVTNVTGLVNATGMYDITVFVNNNTNGVFMMMFIIVFSIIILVMAMKKYDNIMVGLMFMGFFGFATSVGFRALDLIPFSFVIIYGSIMAISAYMVYVGNKS